MVEINITKTDFKLFKTIPPIVRIICAFIFAIVGIMLQIFMPINGVFPYETQDFSYISFIVGLVLIIIALLIVFPERIKISEEPKLADVAPIWKETPMKQLSNVFNVINKRKQKEKSIAEFFDLSKPKGKWIFFGAIVGTTAIYLLVLALSSRLIFTTMVFLLDIYLLLIPIWFIIRIESWSPDILRKILFYHQFSKIDLLDDFEFVTEAAVELKPIKDETLSEELLLPVNVRFMIEFEDAPESFDSLAIQITINEYMGNKFPFFVCFLRMKHPNDWMPLKKDEATVDKIIKIKHMLEEDDLHLFVLSKSPKTENQKHTSPRDAAKIFRRAEKMMRDFA